MKMSQKELDRLQGGVLLPLPPSRNNKTTCENPMKSSIKISNNGNTIRATGAAANALFKALANPNPEKETPTTISTPIFSEYTADGGDYYIRDHEGFKIAEVSNGSKAALIVKAVNEFKALEAVAEAANNHRIAKAAYLKRESSNGLCDVMNHCEDALNEALADLDAVRKEGK